MTIDVDVGPHLLVTRLNTVKTQFQLKLQFNCYGLHVPFHDICRSLLRRHKKDNDNEFLLEEKQPTG